MKLAHLIVSEVSGVNVLLFYLWFFLLNVLFFGWWMKAPSIKGLK
jgi:hypothetical protein